MNHAKQRYRIAVFSVHPAPYRDPVLNKLSQSDQYDFNIYNYFESDAGHGEWGLQPEMARYGQVLRPAIRFGSDAIHPSIMRLIDPSRFDAVVIPGYARISSMVALAACVFRKMPFVLSVDSVKEGRSIRAVRWLREYVYHHAGSYWVPGKAARLYLHRQGIDEARIWEGSYCFDAPKVLYEIITWRKKASALRKELDIPPNAFVFISIGKMISTRRFPLLVRAFMSIMTEVDAYMLVIGNGSDAKEVAYLIRQGASSRIKHLDSIPFADMPKYYAMADCYVHAGSEPYSTASEYAAIAGLPLIMNESVGYTQDLVAFGVPPVGFRDGDSASLGVEMYAMAVNTAVAFEFGRKIQAKAVARSAEWAASELEKAVECACGR